MTEEESFIKRVRRKSGVYAALGSVVAMNIDSGDTPLVLLCPAWKKYGTATTVMPEVTILHSRSDDVVPFTDSEELAANSGLAAEALIEVGDDHCLADPGPLAMMRDVCERAVNDANRKYG